jgi:RNA polymerase sigma-70 factor, ECF subfamily
MAALPESVMRMALLAQADRALSDPAIAAPSVTIEQEVMMFFDQFQPRLLRYALCLGLGVEESEDVVQETFLSLFRHLQLGRPRHNLAGWLFRVTHNLAIKQRNAKQRERAKVHQDSQAVENQLDARANPEEQLADSQRQARALAVVRILPEQDRLCLRLRAEGMRYREISKILGMSLGAVSASLTRSIARIARADGR